MKNCCLTLVTFLVVIILPGCATTSLQNSWKDPGVQAKQYRKLLVVGLANKLQMRQVFEEVFTGEVRKQGVAGIPSYTITGVAEPKPDRASVEEAVKKSGADGVITTRVVDVKRNTDVHTGFVMTDRGMTDIYGVPATYATFVHQPVEVTSSTEAAIETNLFDAETGRLVWSVTSRAVNPEGIINVTRELANLVVKAMARDGLI